LFQLSPGWRLDNNHSAFKSDQWTQLVTSSLSETDPAKQKTLLGQLNDYILDQSFTIAYNTYPTTFLAKANVQGLTYQLHNAGLSFTDTWLA
jgi:ABC-type oligopeptide transport system substrate-binding subunit